MIRYCCILSLVLLLAAPAFASGTTERLQKVERQLDQAQAQKKKLAEESEQLTRELNELREKLIAATTAADQANAQLAELEGSLDDLEGTARRRTTQLQEQRLQLAQTLALMQRMALTPPAVQLASPAPALERLRTDLQLKALLPEIKLRTDELAASVRDLRSLRKRLESQRSRVLVEQANLSRRSSELDRLLSERSARLAQTRTQSASLSARADKLAGEATSLRDLLDKLEREPDDAAAPKPTPLPAGAARRLPVSAPALLRFGQTDAYGNQSNGVTLRPRPGAPVAAVAKGRVAFAGPFRGYGRILILTHSGGFHTVVAGLEKVNAAVGDEVAAGEPLGLMPASRTPAPELYFEVRLNGTPIDPLGKAAAQLSAH